MVSDLHGRTMERIYLTPDDSNEITVELRELGTGLYFVTAVTSGISETLMLTVLN